MNKIGQYNNGHSRYANSYLHRLIMNAPKHLQVDHINGDRLDNRKSNLRLCKNGSNSRNQGQRSGKHKGVHFNKQIKRWIAQITKNYKCHHIGCFLTEKEAALAYNIKAKQLHGKYAYLNQLK